MEMQLIDVVTTYLHGDFDWEISIKVSYGLKLFNSSNSKPHSVFAIRIETLTLYK